MTECSETLFPFEAHFSRCVVAQFTGDCLTTEGGSLLLRQVDRRIGLLRRVATCFTDYRQPERIEHRLEEMLAQRIYGLALGYEDLNDHEQLRLDPLLGVLAGKRDLGEPLAGKSTLNRLELTPVGSPAAERYNKISLFHRSTRRPCWSTCFWKRTRAHRSRSCWTWTPPTRRCTDGRKHVFSTATTGTTAICRCTCFCGDQLLCARLRPSNIDASAGSLEEVQRIVAADSRQAGRRPGSSCARTRASAARSCWPGAKTTMWTTYSALHVTSACDGSSAAPCSEAKQEHRRTGKPARVFCEFYLSHARKAGRRRGA